MGSVDAGAGLVGTAWAHTIRHRWEAIEAAVATGAVRRSALVTASASVTNDASG